MSAYPGRDGYEDAPSGVVWQTNADGVTEGIDTAGAADGDVATWNPDKFGAGLGGWERRAPSVGSIAVEEEGTEIVAAATRINFAGDVAVTDDGGGAVTVTVTSTGGGGSSPSDAAAFVTAARRLSEWAYNGAGNGLVTSLIAAQHNGGSDVVDTDGLWREYGGSAGTFTSISHLPRRCLPVFATRLKMSASITGLKAWWGYSAATPTTAATQANISAFRYLSDIDGTTFRAVTTDAAGAATVTDTGVTVTAGGRYDLVVDESVSGTVTFQINGTTVATHTTTLRAIDTLMPCWNWGLAGTFKWNRSAISSL